jgi:hypothetical protein
MQAHILSKNHVWNQSYKLNFNETYILCHFYFVYGLCGDFAITSNYKTGIRCSVQWQDD